MTTNADPTPQTGLTAVKDVFVIFRASLRRRLKSYQSAMVFKTVYTNPGVTYGGSFPGQR